MFPPYATLFKLPLLGWNANYRETAAPPPRTVVQCQNCGQTYPLSDLLSCELEEEKCPACEMTAQEYWKDKPHQEVPRN